MLNLDLVRGSAIDDPAASDHGFTIRMAGAQLADLIQLNCQNRVSGSFRISSAGSDAYLFFEDGRVAYAELGSLSGLDAVASMLSLRGGVIEPCTKPFPTRDRLDIAADVLLLRAAQRLDESAQSGDRAPEVTTRVVRRVRASTLEQSTLEQSTLHATPANDSVPPEAAAGPSDATAPARGELKRLVSALGVVQLGDDGRVLLLKHGASEELADTAFFVYRMGGLIAETLRLEACKAVYLHNDDIGLVVFKGKSVVGARGKVSELDYVLAKAGFDPGSPSSPPGARAHGSERATDDSGLRYMDGADARERETPGALPLVQPMLAQTELLSAVQHVRGVLGSCVCGSDGRVIVSAMPEDIGIAELETTAARVANLFASADESLADCRSYEVRFEEHQLVVTRHRFGLLFVLTTATPDRALLRVTIRMAARRLEERIGPVVAGSSHALPGLSESTAIAAGGG